ncbi:MAG: DUF4234 domain-containing protein [Bacilli bacterium]|nr:DUF4234 domain-containing protein [Bacilli bacterium]
MPKCPKCGEAFEGRPERCPKCGVKFAYPQPAATKEAAPKKVETESKEKIANSNVPANKAELSREKPNDSTLPASKNEPAKVNNCATNRGFFKFIILSIITLGIYGLIFEYRYGKDLNTCRQAYGLRTKMGFFAAFFLSFVTFGITGLIYLINKVSDTYSLAARETETRGSVATFFVFNILLVWTVVCPIIAWSQLFKTMNFLCEKVNSK